MTIAKTTGFQTSGMNFEQLKTELRKQVDDGKLNNDAELRWTKDKGLYAKNGTWNNASSWFKRMIGSTIMRRGDKYLDARSEVARSINLTYGFQMHGGKSLGEFVVDEMVMDRLRQELGAENVDNLDPAELAARKRNISLRYQDVLNLQRRINGLINENNYRGRVPGRREAELVSSVGYMRGEQTEQSVINGTEAIVQAVQQDFLTYIRNGIIKNHGQVEGDRLFRESFERHRQLARAGAERVVRTAGMKRRQVGKENVNYLPGGLTRRNLEAIHYRMNSIRVDDKYILALGQCTDLPQLINTNGDRIVAQGHALEQLAEQLDSEAVQNQIRHEFDAETAGARIAELKGSKERIGEILTENRGLIRDLKSMSYPNDVVNSDVRAELYDKMVANIREMDGELASLRTILERDQLNIQWPFDAAVSQVFDAAQKYGAQTLDLAASIRPEIPSQVYRRQEPIPFNVKMRGFMGLRGRSGYDGAVETGLRYRASAPEILFEAREAEKSGYNAFVAKHNENIEYISNNYKSYLGNADKSNAELRALRDAGDGAFSSMNSFRRHVTKGMRDLERIIRDMERRQKILGETDNQTLNGELDRARRQHNALLLLYYPRLTRPSNADEAQLPIIDDVDPEDTEEIKRRHDEMSKLFSDYNRDIQEISSNNNHEMQDADDIYDPADATHGDTLSEEEDVYKSVANASNMASPTGADISMESLLNHLEIAADLQAPPDGDVQAANGLPPVDSGNVSDASSSDSGDSLSRVNIKIVSQKIDGVKLEVADDHIESEAALSIKNQLSQLNLNTKFDEDDVQGDVDNIILGGGEADRPDTDNESNQSQGIAGIQNQLARNFDKQEDLAFEQLKKSIEVDCDRLDSVHFETTLWYGQISKELFKKSEAALGGEGFISEFAGKVVYDNECLVVAARQLAEKNDDPGRQEELAKSLWGSFAELVAVKQRLDKFKEHLEDLIITENKNIGLYKSQADYARKPEEPNASVISAVDDEEKKPRTAIQEAEYARKVQAQKTSVISAAVENEKKSRTAIREAEDYLGKMNLAISDVGKLIYGTHALATSLSSPQLLDVEQDGMREYPAEMIKAFDPQTLYKYNAFGKNHALSTYDDAATPGVDQKNSIDRYLKGLSYAGQNFDDIENLTPQINQALRLNTEFTKLFADKNFTDTLVEETTLTPNDITQISHVLSNDRATLHEIRLGALIMAHAKSMNEDDIDLDNVLNG